jgi:hypothetical protein
LVYFMDTWSILRSFVIFCGHLVYFLVIWYIFPIWVFCTKKNLATLDDDKTAGRTIFPVDVARRFFVRIKFCPTSLHMYILVLSSWRKISLSEGSFVRINNDYFFGTTRILMSDVVSSSRN